MAARTLQAHLHGTEFDIERLCNFGEGQLFVAGEYEDDALRFRELSYGAGEGVAHLRVKYFVFRSGLRRRRDCLRFLNGTLQVLFPGYSEKICPQRRAVGS